MLPWLLCGALLAVVLFLWAKLRLLQRSLDEITAGMEEHLSQDTNTLLSLSTRDPHARRLAAGLNRQLRLLRDERRRFQQGDRELKDAVTNISHDLRTPLTAICGYLDLLEREEKSPEAQRYLAIIRERAEMLTRLTEELFRYSVISSGGGEGEAETVAVDAVLQESIAAFYTELTGRGIVPAIHLPETPVPRRLDPAALSRVFSNLLANAVKYSDGDLDIALSPAGEIVFSNACSGLDPVQVGRLFDRFYTVEAARGSTGLGLAIARTLVERMGGSISAVYEDGRLRVRVLFPEH
ncbi:MAG: sensor histidine kinase [Oscillospiraceae bacterium]